MLPFFFNCSCCCNLQISQSWIPNRCYWGHFQKWLKFAKSRHSLLPWLPLLLSLPPFSPPPPPRINSLATGDELWDRKTLIIHLINFDHWSMITDILFINTSNFQSTATNSIDCIDSRRHPQLIVRCICPPNLFLVFSNYLPYCDQIYNPLIMDRTRLANPQLFLPSQSNEVAILISYHHIC